MGAKVKNFKNAGETKQRIEELRTYLWFSRYRASNAEREGKRFQVVDKTFRYVMEATHKASLFSYCDD